MRNIVFYEVTSYSVKFEGCITSVFPIMLLSETHSCEWESARDTAEPSQNATGWGKSGWKAA